MVTLTFDLETGAHYCSWHGQSTNFAVSGTFHSRHNDGPTLSGGPRDLITVTFDFRRHGSARDAALHAPIMYQVLSS